MQEGTINRVFRSSFPETERTGFRTNAWRYGTAQRPEDLKPRHATMLHALATAAKLEESIGITVLPEKPSGSEVVMSYRELYHTVVRNSKSLEDLGVKAGDRVLLVLPTGIEFVQLFFAIQLLGAVAVPAYPPAGLRMRAGLDRLAHIADHAGTRLCITDARIKRVMGNLALSSKSIENIVAHEEMNPGEDTDAKFRAKGADPSFIQYTSGSTGNPKGVLLSHKNLVSNIEAIGQALQINRNDVMVSWCPLYHDMGLIGGLLMPIYWRIPLVLMSPVSFLTRPSRWLWAMHDYRGSLSPSPNFGYGMAVSRIKPEEREGLDLSSWRLAMNGAEPVNYRTVVDFCQTYEPYGFKANAFLPVYGLAEGTLAAAFPRLGADVRYEVVDRQELANGRAVLASGKGSMAVVGCGTRMPGHDIVIVDEHGEVLPEREVGHVVIMGDSVMVGYYKDEAATKAVIHDGWLWTGDLGYFADEQLFVTGRAKDLIIVRGRNIYAEDIERVAERVDGVRPSGVVAFGVYDEEEKRDRVILVCETKVADDAKEKLIEATRTKVAEFCDVHLDEIVLAVPGTIPKTSSGKRQRSKCREQYLRGELKSAKLSKVQIGVVLARSTAGMLLLKAKGLLRGREGAEK